MEDTELLIVTELREVSQGRFLAGFSDGSELHFGLNALTELSLYKGRELTKQEHEKLLSLVNFCRCRERALRIIGARAMSGKELFDRLVQKGETTENAEDCVAWLYELRYLDDVRYAETIVAHYGGRGYGAQRIKNELYRRGVPLELWDSALKELEGTEDKAYAFLCRKLGDELPDRAEMKRASDALFRRGFSWDEINAAMRRFLEEHRD